VKEGEIDMPDEEKTDIEKLIEIQNSGIQTISVDGQTITYRNNEELEKIIQKNLKISRAGIKKVYVPKFKREES